MIKLDPIVIDESHMDHAIVSVPDLFKNNQQLGKFCLKNLLTTIMERRKFIGYAKLQDWNGEKILMIYLGMN